jgi:hypothetical protein
MLLFPEAQVAEARAVHCIDEANRRSLKLRKAGYERVGPCPVCGGTDRFAINLRKNVWHCRGCGTGGGIVELVMHLDGCGFRQAVATLIAAPSGQVDPTIIAASVEVSPLYDAPSVEPPAAPIGDWDADEERRIEGALKWWKDAKPIKGTIAERYLRDERGILGLPRDVDEVLRFHGRCVFGRDDNDRPIYHPCLIALFRDVITDKPCGIHRIALTTDGKKIDRKALGRKKSTAVKLWGDAEVTYGLTVGEGVETTLAAALYVRHDNTCLRPAWALVDAGNLKDFPVLDGIEHLTILSDNDAPDARGRQRGQEAAEICGQRWIDAGRDAELFLPNNAGEDFNDIGRRHARVAP